MNNDLVYTTQNDVHKIVKILNIEFVDFSRVDGFPIFKLLKESKWDKYKDFFEAEIIQTLEDHSVAYMNPPQPVVPNPPTGFRVIKIVKWSPRFFREKKLNRILNERV